MNKHSTIPADAAVCGRSTIPLTADEDLLCCLGPAFADLAATDPSRISRIAAELADGFTRLRHLTKAVSVFGSARLPADHPDCGLARHTARLLGEAGFAIITGRPAPLPTRAVSGYTIHTQRDGTLAAITEGVSHGR